MARLQTGKKRKLQGLCPRCKTIWRGLTYYCPRCTRQMRLISRKRRAGLKHLCTRCAARPPKKNSSYCGRCEINSAISSKSFRLRERERVISAYGSKCNCCGNPNSRVLELDHINNNGKSHRSKINAPMFRWVVRHGFPKGLQLLCANCHRIKTKYGECLPSDHWQPEAVASNVHA